MSPTVVAFVSGVIFAVGLALAGMTDPARVTAFLDIAGRWDPTLALVMGGAIAVYLPGYLLVRRRRAPILGSRFAVPEETPIDRSLLGGAAAFGVGWGLVGLCPGPAITSLAAGSFAAWLFAGSMLAGMFGYERFRAGASRPAPASPR